MTERSAHPIHSLSVAPSATTPLRVKMQGKQVDLWAVEYNDDTHLLSSFEEILSDEERTRAQRFRFPPGKNQFIHARGTLRVLLARYLDVEPVTLRFGYEENRKPYLVTATGTRSPLQFNLSHTDGLAVYAMTRDGELGVDVERLRPELADEQTVRQFFAPTELCQWQRLSSSLQPLAFFHIWTCKEAYVKALGTGLTVAPEILQVDLDKDATPDRMRVPPSYPSGIFYSFVLRDKYVGALSLLTGRGLEDKPFRS